MFLIVSFIIAGLFANDGILAFIRSSTKINPKNISIYFGDMNGNTVYSHKVDKKMSIASLNKLYTTLTALHYLGEGYRFKTDVYGKIVGSHVENLVIKGGADPLFVPEELWSLLNKLKSIGISSIGTLILDNSMFTPYRIGNGDRAYNTQVLPLSLNFNSTAVNLISGPSPYVSIYPKTTAISLSKNMSYCKKCITRASLRRINNTVYVNGVLSTDRYYLKTLYRNLDNPEEQMLELTKTYLGLLDIKLNKISKRYKAKSTSSYDLLFSHESRRLEDILTDMNRFSNNFIAELIFRAIEAKTNRRGVEIISDFISTYLNVSREDLQIVDPSGMNIANKSSVKVLVKLLTKVYKDFKYSPAFVNSLSVSGKDGTIKSLNTGYLIRAKTGTLNNIKSLAGYILYRQKVFPFAIIANDRNAFRLMNVFESIFSKILKTGRFDK